MRIRKVSGNEVMVYLTPQDLDYFNFHPGNLPEEGDLHKFLFHLMELVQSETGFDPYNGGQVIVEAVHSDGGMRLNISKIDVESETKITREQFKRVKAVRVREKRTGVDEIRALTNEELLDVIHNMGLKRIKNRSTDPKPETFVFENFTALEGALCHMGSDALEKCVLYRNGEKYAITAEIKRGDKVYNLLSEFADINRGGTVLAADIGEGWNEVAQGEKLQVMADAVKAMQ